MWPGRLAWLALNASDQWTSLFNGSYFRRLDCEDDRRWSSFRRQLETLLAKGRLVGEDVALQATAEELLTPWDEKPRDVFQAATEAFRARLLAATAPSAPRTTSRMGLCFPGYQAACWVRILGLHTTLAQGAREDAQELEIMIETNAQHCSSIFGKEASLEYLSSTSWPVRLLDLELFMRSCPDAAFGMRRMRTLPVEIQTFEHFRQLLRRPAVESSAPRRFTPSSGDGGLAPWSPTLRVTSVFGGHCSLWLETLYTLWSLFADLIDPFLVTYNHEDGCLERFGLRDVLPHAPVLGDEEQGSRGSVDQMLRSSDLLVCMWVSECSRLRAHYSKPVIFYSGFLLLNDQSFHPGHAWSEALFHFWQRLSDLFACDVLAAKDGTPVVGPPCLVLFEERPLAEVAYWQTGQRKPVVRPLSLYVRCLHDPENAKQEVLIIHRGRLTSDGTEAKALNAMKHAFYPYSFVDQEDGMPFASMAEFRSVVLLPWDLNLVMFHDLYAMAVPLFLPDRNGLHHTAFTFLSRFQKSLTTGMPFKERLPEMEEKETHPFSPFDFEYLEVREFWLDYTEYVTAPAILHFASLPDLLVQVYQLDAIKTHGRIRAHNARRLRESRNFWSNALQRLATPWAPWGGEHWDASCGAEHPLKPQGSVLWSPLDGAPWIHAAPSRAEPLLIMDGADGALSAAVREAVEEFQRRAKPSHSEVFAGALDWKAIHQRLKGCAGGRRVEKLRCLLVMERVRPFLPLLRLTDLVRKGRRQLSRLLDPEGSVALAIWRMRKCVVLLPEPGFQEVIAYHFPYLKLNNQELLWPNRTTSSSSTGFGHRQIRAPHFLVSRLSSQLRRERLLHRAGRRQFVRQLQRLRAETR
ncbi:unnamed protein product [Durusdinium trenchii]|uniref:Uncharacterized protein n=1 Tax=Durusdinium trenchii TaxID=1381693 RepID=A0ABP0M1D9_9DINO